MTMRQNRRGAVGVRVSMTFAHGRSSRHLTSRSNWRVPSILHVTRRSIYRSGGSRARRRDTGGRGKAGKLISQRENHLSRGKQTSATLSRRAHRGGEFFRQVEGRLAASLVFNSVGKRAGNSLQLDGVGGHRNSWGCRAVTSSLNFAARLNYTTLVTRPN